MFQIITDAQTGQTNVIRNLPELLLPAVLQLPDCRDLESNTERRSAQFLGKPEQMLANREQDSVIPVVLPDMVLSHHAEPHYEPAAPACREAMTCEVTVGGASLRLSGDLSPALLKTLIRELSGRSR